MDYKMVSACINWILYSGSAWGSKNFVISVHKQNVSMFDILIFDPFFRKSSRTSLEKLMTPADKVNDACVLTDVQCQVLHVYQDENILIWYDTNPAL